MVVFTEREEVDVVSTVWLTEEKSICLGPPFRNPKHIKWVAEKKEEPDTCTWSRHKVRVLKETGTNAF